MLVGLVNGDFMNRTDFIDVNYIVFCQNIKCIHVYKIIKANFMVLTVTLNISNNIIRTFIISFRYGIILSI